MGDVYPAVDSVPAEENQTEQDTPPRVAEAEQNSATVRKQKKKMSNSSRKYFIALKGLCHGMDSFFENFLNQFLELAGFSMKQAHLNVYFSL